MLKSWWLLRFVMVMLLMTSLVVLVNSNDLDDWDEDASDTNEQWASFDVNAKAEGKSASHSDTPISTEDNDWADVSIVEEEFSSFHSDDILHNNEDNEDNDDDDDDDKKPKLQMKRLPIIDRTVLRAKDYIGELICILGVLVYILNFAAGRTTNKKLIRKCHYAIVPVLDEQFSLVGESEKDRNILIQENESLYFLWCSGRISVNGALLSLELYPRQCAFSRMYSLIDPSVGVDRIRCKLYFDNNAMSDGFIFALSQRKVEKAIRKSHSDLRFVSSAAGHGLPANFVVMSESGDITTQMLTDVSTVITEHAALVESILFTDADMPRPPTGEEESALLTVQPSKMAYFVFRIPKESDVATTALLIKMMLFMVDRAATMRLSVQAKSKTDSRRANESKKRDKLLHAQRQEEAQKRKLDKRKEEKQRVDSMDADAQRRWERKDHERSLKQRAKKMTKVSSKHV